MRLKRTFVVAYKKGKVGISLSDEMVKGVWCTFEHCSNSRIEYKKACIKRIQINLKKYKNCTLVLINILSATITKKVYIIVELHYLLN